MGGTNGPDPKIDPFDRPEVEEDSLHVGALRQMKIRHMWQSIKRRAEAAEAAERKKSSSEEDAE
jgi:hypothetical protein